MVNINDISYDTYFRILLELLTVVGLISIVANFFLIFVIIKYKKLREDTTNLIFLHLNIMQVVILIGTLITQRIEIQYEFSSASKVHARVFCILYQIDVSVLLFGILGVLFLLVCDSFIKIYYKNKYQSFGLFCKFALIGFYILPGCIPFILVPYCVSDPYFILLICLIMIVCTAIVASPVIIINIIHAIKKRKLINYKSSNIGLVVPNIFFLLWCPTLTIALLCMFVLSAPIVAAILCVLLFLNPVFNLLYVYFYDSDYKIFLKLCFTCKCNEYSTVNLEDQSVTYNDVNDGVVIS
ncbi:uncharacterized protein LOC123013662 [Tribolium madens]|uniref:uncharacterized protein LOC123013662 n=1 Tax=Tribolium madens TaxID=41895 RepID=UPI001CF73E88|nr:uncharacterized protein LOC123013662 [Tribolium madens]